jgi:RTX calcium-binding nonapeptide repeat (4 copies)
MVVAGAVRLGVAVVVACGALATGAHAASVALVRDGVADPDLDRYALSFQAAPGEANRLTLSQSADGLSWSFHDAGAVMVPGANCAAAPDAGVVCALAPTVYYRALVTGRVDLGDADDTAEVATQTRQEIDAGSGDDALTLHAGSGTVSLGPGRDAAVADAGSWDVDGGPGPDATGASGTAEVQVNYGKAPGPVSVSLDAQANDGTAGEGDDVGAGVTGIFASAYGDVLDASAAPGAVAVTAFDGDDIVRGAPAGGILDGGAGDDVLVGSGGHDILIGDEGDDQLFGGAGDDGLSGGAGRNLVDGGAGGDSYNIASASRDTIRARDATTDSVECLTLPGVLDVDPTDVLKSCAPRVVAPREATARLRAHRLRFALRCPSTALERCRGTVRLSDVGRRALGFARFSIARGSRARVAVRLRRRPRGRDLTASFVTHRARPPASERTTLWAFRLR